MKHTDIRKVAMDAPDKKREWRQGHIQKVQGAIGGGARERQWAQVDESKGARDGSNSSRCRISACKRRETRSAEWKKRQKKRSAEVMPYNQAPARTT